ncbi:MAG: lipoprotein-releasing system ATP-binding protein LolD [Bacteroidia bacterium]|nr:MAG: lipoprotein-releasing system ATP-binding protein LolD [Bacteroidia bacterium]
MIATRAICKSFGSLQVLKGIDLHIPAGRLATIVGASGAGKTTLLQILGTLLPPDGGELIIDGDAVQHLGPKAIAAFRNEKIGFVFQFHHLLPEFNALENVCLPALIRNDSMREARRRATELLEYLGLRDRLSHKPSELSGGEQQRVAVARALVNRPRIILADEPSGNLDSRNREELHGLFFQLCEEFGQTFVVVTHDQHLADSAHLQLRMEDGRIVA